MLIVVVVILEWRVEGEKRGEERRRENREVSYLGSFLLLFVPATLSLQASDTNFNLYLDQWPNIFGRLCLLEGRLMVVLPLFTATYLQQPQHIIIDRRSLLTVNWPTGEWIVHQTKQLLIKLHQSWRTYYLTFLRDDIQQNFDDDLSKQVPPRNHCHRRM